MVKDYPVNNATGRYARTPQKSAHGTRCGRFTLAVGACGAGNQGEIADCGTSRGTPI